MKCIEAEEYMMNYMDDTLSPEAAEKLNEHLKSCDKCREAFYIYETIQTTLEETEIIEAPANFEAELMLKINDITPVYLNKKDLAVDTLNSIVWGSFTIFLGTGIILNMYKDNILNYVTQNEYISNFYNAITPLSNLITDSINDMFMYVQNFVLSVDGVFVYFKIIFGILIAAICFLQAWVKSKEKVDA